MTPNSAVNGSELLDIQTTPLLPVTTLAALIYSASPRLTPEFVVKIMVQVCRGVQAGHDKGALTGALTPSNILILQDDTAKIVEFSVAQEYFAPEQLGHGQANRSSDVFSLGVIAYEALTLQQPFRRPTLEETAEAIRHFVPPPVSEKNPHVGVDVSKAVQVALAKRPEDRCATAGEFANALEKAADPAKPDALAEMLDRARTHIDGHRFAEARQALTEIFNLQYDHPAAARLQAALDAQEAEAQIVRTEKEKLFTVAQRCQRNGELGSALAQLEKLLALSREVPGSCVAERETVFEALYAELRSERDRVEQCCSEAARALAENNCEEALAICDDLQARYPHNQEFQGLRLKAQQAQRRQILAYAGEVARSVEAEPNLDGRVCLLQEAVKRYPNEELLARQLALACEQRDIAASIVAKARAYEGQGQFAEAVNQWKTLLSIHPLYPGLAAEIQHLEQRREQKTDEDKRARLISEIERALASGAYADAERLSQEALREFPEHPQLSAALSRARRGFEKCREADGLVEQAKTVRAGGDADRAMMLLRQALDLDPRHVVGRNTLVHLLLERSQALLGTDMSSAEPLAAEAAKLDPDHSAVQKILKLVGNAKRKNRRRPALLEAGSGVTANDVHLTLVPAGRKSIPATEPIKLFLDDDFPESSAASRRTVPQPPQPFRRPALVEQFYEIASVLAYNVKTRLLDSSVAPLYEKFSELSSRLPVTARQTRGLLFGLLCALVPVLLLSVTYLYVSRPHLGKATTAPEARIAPASPVPPAVTMRSAPSYASLRSDGDSDASTAPPLEPVSPQPTVSSTNSADQTSESPAAERSLPSVKPAAATVRAERVGVKKDTPRNRQFDNSVKSPRLALFTISSGTPQASVIVDDINIGELDEKGNFAYAGITAGTHKIELRKQGYGSRTFYGQAFRPGKPYDLPGDKQLSRAAGYAHIAVSPLRANVSYRRSGESAKHPVSDTELVLALPPGAYEFSADAPQFVSKLVYVEIQADQTTAISFDLKPSARTVVEQTKELVNPDKAIKMAGR